jgi:phage shock protein E
MPYRLAFASAVLFAATVLAQSDSGLNEVKDKVAKGQARLIDVREEAEWKEGHLRNATLVPLTQIAKGLDANTLKDLKAKPVYVHCKAGIRAQKAAALLKAAGVDVTALKATYDELEPVFGKGK